MENKLDGLTLAILESVLPAKGDTVYFDGRLSIDDKVSFDVVYGDDIVGMENRGGRFEAFRSNGNCVPLESLSFNDQHILSAKAVTWSAIDSAGLLEKPYLDRLMAVIDEMPKEGDRITLNPFGFCLDNGGEADRLVFEDDRWCADAMQGYESELYDVRSLSSSEMQHLICCLRVRQLHDLSESNGDIILRSPVHLHDKNGNVLDVERISSKEFLLALQGNYRIIRNNPGENQVFSHEILQGRFAVDDLGKIVLAARNQICLDKDQPDLSEMLETALGDKLQELDGHLFVEGTLDLTDPLLRDMEQLPAGLEVGGNLILTNEYASENSHLREFPVGLHVHGNVKGHDWQNGVPLPNLKRVDGVRVDGYMHLLVDKVARVKDVVVGNYFCFENKGEKLESFQGNRVEGNLYMSGKDFISMRSDNYLGNALFLDDDFTYAKDSHKVHFGQSIECDDYSMFFGPSGEVSVRIDHPFEMIDFPQMSHDAAIFKGQSRITGGRLFVDFTDSYSAQSFMFSEVESNYRLIDEREERRCLDILGLAAVAVYDRIRLPSQRQFTDDQRQAITGFLDLGSDRGYLVADLKEEVGKMVKHQGFTDKWVEDAFSELDDLAAGRDVHVLQGLSR